MRPPNPVCFRGTRDVLPHITDYQSGTSLITGMAEFGGFQPDPQPVGDRLSGTDLDVRSFDHRAWMKLRSATDNSHLGDPTTAKAVWRT